MNSIIGKKYWPIDNSYSVCFDDLNKKYQLAGNHYKEAKQPEETEVVSEPYIFWIWSYGEPKAHMFVNVKCSRGLVHRTLFGERGFEPRVNEPARDWLYDWMLTSCSIAH